MSKKISAKWGKRWKVTVLAPEGVGTGKTTPTQGVYTLKLSEAFTITATPDEGSAFEGWIVDGVAAGNTNPLVLKVS